MDPLRVVVQTGTGYELLLSAVVLADASARRRIEMAPELRARAKHVDPTAITTLRRVGREPFISLLGWAHAMADPPDASTVLEAVRVADPRELRLAALGYYRRSMRAAASPALTRAAVDGDAAAIRELRRTVWPGLRHWQATLRYLLSVDDETFRGELGRSLTAWYREGFLELEPRLAAAQVASADRSRELVRTRGLHDVIDVLAPGMVFARELGQSVVVLVPSTVVRPSFAITDYGSTLVIVHPAEPRQEPDVETARLATLANALGDPLRVRALQVLAAGPLSTSELARRLDVPRTSLQHHVSVLLSAGVASMAVDDAAQGLIALRHAGIAELATLVEPLGHEEAPAARGGPGPRSIDRAEDAVS